jgi:cytochrome c oxidase subunit II
MPRGPAVRCKRTLKLNQNGISVVFVLLAGLPTVGEPAQKSFEVKASQYEFAPSTIEVSEGDEVKLSLTASDRDHGIAIPEFKVKTKIPKGAAPVTVTFVASKAGTFKIECSEYCGPGHRRMNGRLVVTPRSK